LPGKIFLSDISAISVKNISVISVEKKFLLKIADVTIFVIHYFFRFDKNTEFKIF